MTLLRKTRGLHIIIDLFGCDPHQINSSRFWENTFSMAAQSANMEVLHTYFYEFKPQGITGFSLLSTSHISVHSWPEYNYVACDVFSCSDDANTIKAAEVLIKAINCTRKRVQKIKRGYNIMEYLETPIYKNGKMSHIKVVKKLYEITSAFQNIIVANLKKFGKSLVIDGIVQTSEMDHAIYDKALLTPLKSTDKKIFILGGGDGYVAQLALEMNPDLDITVIDLDPEVINISKRYLNQEIFSHPNVHLKIGDALTHLKTYLERGGEEIDGIISDLTDNPVGGRGAKTRLKNFYQEVLELSKQALKKDGWISTQAGAAAVVPQYIDAASIIQDLLNRTFGNYKRKDVMIPSFGEKNAFIWAVK